MKYKQNLHEMNETNLELTREKKDEYEELCRQVEEWKKRKTNVSLELQKSQTMQNELNQQLEERERAVKALEMQIVEAEGSVRTAQRDKERDEARHNARLVSMQKTIADLSAKEIAFEKERKRLEADLADERRRNEDAKSDLDDLKQRLDLERANANEMVRSRSASDKQWLKRIEDANMEMQKLRAGLQAEFERSRLSWQEEKDEMNEKHAEALRQSRENEKQRSTRRIEELKNEFDSEQKRIRDDNERQLEVCSKIGLSGLN
jgi:hypothetical protein